MGGADQAAFAPERLLMSLGALAPVVVPEGGPPSIRVAALSALASAT
jgi:hypothetical protein